MNDETTPMSTTPTRTSKLGGLRRKRVWIPAVAAVAVLGAGGAGIAVAANADDTAPVTGADRDRVGAAALEAVGGGEVLTAETSDDRGEAYEVDVLDAQGVEWSISLDEDLAVVERDRDGDHDGDRDGDRDGDHDGDHDGDRGDSDDVPVTGAEREEAAAAAVEEVGSGEATVVERSDDAGETFEVEVVADDGAVWDVTLDDQLAVLSSRQDRD